MFASDLYVASLEDLAFFKKLISVRSLCTTREEYEQAAHMIKEKLENIGLSPEKINEFKRNAKVLTKA